jgi:hypothetical protein
MLTRNESTRDRIVRGVVGGALVAVAAGLGVGSPLGILTLAVGGVLLFTAATGFCLIYRLLGTGTCRSC